MNKKLLVQGFLGCWLTLMASLALAAAPDPQNGYLTDSTQRPPPGRSVLGIIAGGASGTYIRIASDMASVLDGPDLRIIAMVGQGSAQNINDLLYLKGVDMAIVQSDVLEYFKRHRSDQRLENKISYITKLYNEEFHLIATEKVGTLADLAGKKVNFDVRGSGTALTASLLFDTLKIAVEPTHFDQATAMQKLKGGEISALAYVAGKPTALFEKLAAADQLHFLSVQYTPDLMETYLPATLSAQDYPTLVPADQEIRTIAVGAVLAAYHWNAKSQRYRKVANFTNALFQHFNEFRQPARHPKWREVSLSAILPGWTRFPAAEDWLKNQPRQP
ncbi:MAG: TAXI family TRAP transporter solute-binding subunit [Candidatus Competibacteraceae bacterium]|nr:TAXI family TRAP transporter solute-binding subunit [Candidatus Competibacteraceae bacterium]